MTALDPDLFMPEPLPRDVKYTVISVDDHVVEPAHLFNRYLPPKLRAGGPQIVETGNGAEVWEFEGQIYSQVGMNALAGRTLPSWPSWCTSTKSGRGFQISGTPTV